MRHPLDEIRQLQAWRGRGGGDASIARMVGIASEKAQRTHRRLGQLIDLWQQLLPPELVARTVLGGIRNGVLVVKVDSAATAFEVDRLLRGGIASHLRARYRGTLLRVKTSVEPLDAEDDGSRKPPGQAVSNRKAGRGYQGQRPAAKGASRPRIGARPRGR